MFEKNGYAGIGRYCVCNRQAFQPDMTKSGWKAWRTTTRSHPIAEISFSTWIMTDVLRQEIAALATTLVVKVGTRVLTRDDGQLDQARIDQLARATARRASTAAGRSCWSVPGRSGPAWDAWA